MLIVHEFMSLDGVMQAPGGKNEDQDGGFRDGGWTVPYWHDGIGARFVEVMQNVDAFLLGRRTYVIHAGAFEPMAPGDSFGDLMNAPKKYVVSRTLKKPVWRDTTIIRDDPMGARREPLHRHLGLVRGGDQTRSQLGAGADARMPTNRLRGRPASVSAF